MKNNQINIPEARNAMDQFKMQAASEVGVNLTNGYNGHPISSKATSAARQSKGRIRKLYCERHTTAIQTTQHAFLRPVGRLPFVVNNAHITKNHPMADLFST